MMPYVNPEAMTAVGSKTKQTVIYKSESHKLHQAFPVKKMRLYFKVNQYS